MKLEDKNRNLSAISPIAQKDVQFRKEASTVSSKIQAFIPGNLIVVRV